MQTALGHVWAVRGGRMSARRVWTIVLVLGTSPLSLPVIAVLALMVWIADGANPFVTQRRIGHGGRMFRLWKLRSMRAGAEAELVGMLGADRNLSRQWREGQKLWDDPRVTRMGRWLRRYSLDELPQLWNVLLGDMNLVGPRPVTAQEFLAHYRDEAARAYLSVRPGMTGLWQVSGRNALSYAQRVDLDWLYVRRRCWQLDLDILLRTFGVVLGGNGR